MSETLASRKHKAVNQSLTRLENISTRMHESSSAVGDSFSSHSGNYILGVTCRVHVVDLENDNISPPVNIRAYTTQTVAEFHSMIGEVLDVPIENMRCVLERAGEVRYLSSLGRTLKGEGFIKSNKVFIEYSGQEDPSISFVDSQFHQILDRYENTITLHVTLPSKEEVQSFVQQKMVSDAIRERIREEHQEEMRRQQQQQQQEQPHQQQEEQQTFESETGTKVSEENNGEETQEREGDRERTPEGSEHGIFDDFDIDLTANEQKVETSSVTDSQGVAEALEGLRASENFGSQNTTDASDSSSQTDQTLRNTQSEDSLHSEGSGSNSSWQMTAECNSITSLDDKAQGSPRKAAENWDDESARQPCPGKVENWDDDPDMQPSPRQSEENWDNESATQPFVYDYDEQYRKYFKAYLMQNTCDTDPRQLTVYVDKRISLSGLKKELEQYVGTTSENFKIFRVYPNNQEFESTKLSDSLMSFGEESRINLKLGRALRKGEYRVKVYQLLVHEQEPIKFLIETVFAKGMTILESKKLILPEIKKQCDLDIPLNRCRLRKKTWKNPGTIYLDHQAYEEDVQIFANWDIFLEVLKDDEKLTTTSQYAIYVRQWRPSKYELEPFDEVVINSSSVDELKYQLNQLSGIPVENIEFAKCRGTFPCEMSLLEIHNELEWNPSVSNLYVFPLYICDDGSVVYYRDNREPLMELSEDRRREIQQKESIRLSKLSPKVTCSPRKEKALKIYTDEPPSS